MKRYRRTIAMCSVLCMVTAAFAAIPQADRGLTANPVYQKNCEKCHGKTAEGRHFAGPSLHSEKAGAMSTGDLHNMIANGKGHMPKFGGKLTAEEIDTLTKEIEALNKK